MVVGAVVTTVNTQKDAEVLEVKIRGVAFNHSNSARFLLVCESLILSG